jgi:Uma2 family endonuclease
MATVTATRKRVHRKRARVFGPESAGTLMTPQEFDRAKFVEGWRYELIHGVLIVSPTPLENERDPNGELCYLLRNYRAKHPPGASLDGTLYEQTVKTRQGRWRADRVIWAGLGRHPRRNETPTIVVEFVSEGTRDRERDYDEKRDEYLEIGVKEYWLIDRFKNVMTVCTPRGKSYRKKVIPEKQNYTTPLLPGFELPLGELIALANSWPEAEPGEE